MDIRNDLYNDLLNVIKSGSLEEVKEAVTIHDCNLTLNQSTKQDFELLISAIDRSDEERIGIIKLLLEKGCQINNRNEHFINGGAHTPLYHAINRRDTQIVQLLLENGASLEDFYDGENKIFDFVMTLVHHDIFDLVMILDFPKRLTPVHVACMKGDTIVIEYFIKYGLISEIISPAWRDYTPLHLAVMYKQKEAIKLLITRGASINTKDSAQRTPLDHAIELAEANGDWTICDFLLREFPYREDLNGYGTTLHAAVKHKRTELISSLLSIKVNICVKNRSGLTPLHMAYHDACKSNSCEIVDLLLYNNAHAICENPEDNNGLTHFHIACSRQDPIIVRQLLGNGASITDKYGKYGLTPLHFAIYQLNPNENIIYMLLENHKKICKNPVDGYGLSHFHIACSRNLPQVVQKFIESGVDINQKVPDTARLYAGYAPLHIAVQNTCVDVVRLLLEENNILVNIESSVSKDLQFYPNYTHTPIDFAPFYDDSDEDDDIFNILISNGANAFRKTIKFNEKSLIEVAYEKGFKKRVDHILFNYRIYQTCIPNRIPKSLDIKYEDCD